MIVNLEYRWAHTFSGKSAVSARWSAVKSVVSAPWSALVVLVASATCVSSFSSGRSFSPQSWRTCVVSHRVKALQRTLAIHQTKNMHARMHAPTEPAHQSVVQVGLVSTGPDPSLVARLLQLCELASIPSGDRLPLLLRRRMLRFLRHVPVYTRAE
jgi:hypothetical protein